MMKLSSFKPIFRIPLFFSTKRIFCHSYKTRWQDENFLLIWRTTVLRFFKKRGFQRCTTPGEWPRHLVRWKRRESNRPRKSWLEPGLHMTCYFFSSWSLTTPKKIQQQYATERIWVPTVQGRVLWQVSSASGCVLCLSHVFRFSSDVCFLGDMCFSSK